MSRLSVLIVAAVLAAPIPLALAGSSHREDRVSEPNSIYDVGTMNWGSATTDSGKIYLNGFMYQASVARGNAKVTVQVADSRIFPNDGFAFGAYLGFWRDCNGDGFIGHAGTGTDPYHVSQGAGVCNAMPYNDGSFVHEFIWIGARTQGPISGDLISAGVTAPGNLFAIEDDASNVWADWNLPWDIPATTIGLFPFPPHTMDDGKTFADYSLLLTPVNYEATVDGATSPGTWASTYDGTAGGALSQVPVWRVRALYNDTSPDEANGRGTPFVRVWERDASGDCTGDLDVRDVNTAGSIEPTTQEVAQLGGTNLAGSRPCNNSDGEIHYNGGTTVPHHLEAVGLGFVTKKDRADNPLYYVPGHRTTVGPGAGGPLGFGLLPTGATGHTEGASHNPIYVSRFTWLFTDASLAGSSFNGYQTFYASVSAATFSGATSLGVTGASAATSLPSGTSTFRYGSDHCTETGTEITGTWFCDAVKWGPAPGGSNDPSICLYQGRDVCAVIGDAYNLRDIDCWDNTVLGLRAKLPAPLTWTAAPKPDAVGQTNDFVNFMTASFDPTDGSDWSENPRCV